ncbi:MAG: hypothetical protein H6Q36_1586 [Chloroflexi bacterium]|nr:hypothetical protein [Chloroflexota bacterium]
MGIRVPTIGPDENAIRCRGCGSLIEGQPFRVSVMDTVAIERAPSSAGQTPINPGPFQFHPDPACVRAWMRERGYLFCRHGSVRALMRPVVIPGEPPRLGLCDGMHRDDHAFVPA